MKLKQKLAIGLCAFYLFSVIGIALSFHFCGGHLENVKLFADATSCKFCADIPLAKKANADCCKNTKVEVKVKDNHQATVAYKLPKLFTSDLFLPATFFQTAKVYQSSIVAKLSNKAPPKLFGVAIHIINCVFRN